MTIEKHVIAAIAPVVMLVMGYSLIKNLSESYFQGIRASAIFLLFSLPLLLLDIGNFRQTRKKLKLLKSSKRVFFFCFSFLCYTHISLLQKAIKSPIRANPFLCYSIAPIFAMILAPLLKIRFALIDVIFVLPIAFLSYKLGSGFSFIQEIDTLFIGVVNGLIFLYIILFLAGTKNDKEARSILRFSNVIVGSAVVVLDGFLGIFLSDSPGAFGNGMFQYNLGIMIRVCVIFLIIMIMIVFLIDYHDLFVFFNISAVVLGMAVNLIKVSGFNFALIPSAAGLSIIYGFLRLSFTKSRMLASDKHH
ncbi:hypothetical protein PCE1_000781 [Barthelona sp. PCE]